MIDLISDTVTKPSPGMLEAMMKAEVGDDVFRADPSINHFEEKIASLFGKENALFCPSGTMTNQIAIKTHTQALDEVICDISSHVYQYETGGYAYNSRVGVKLIHGDYGRISPAQIRNAIQPDYDWLPNSKLVVIENSCNKGGGNYYILEELQAIHKTCAELNLKLHLDGARLFNVLVETQDSPAAIGALFDSISICMSKGLGAPVGSALIGDAGFIKRARKFRKVMGGGMRQAGFLAAACTYALDHQVDRLKKDNENARLLGKHLEGMTYVKEVLPVKTNIVIFALKENHTAATFVESLKQQGINASAFGPQQVRFVTHRDIHDEMIQKVLAILSELQD